MKTFELWKWTIRDPDTSRAHRTRYVMSEADALSVDPQAQRVPGSLEVRQLSDDPGADCTGYAMQGMPPLER